MNNLAQLQEAFAIFAKYSRGDVRVLALNNCISVELEAEKISQADLRLLRELRWCYSSLSGWYLNL